MSLAHKSSRPNFKSKHKNYGNEKSFFFFHLNTRFKCNMRINIFFKEFKWHRNLSGGVCIYMRAYLNECVFWCMFEWECVSIYARVNYYHQDFFYHLPLFPQFNVGVFFLFSRFRSTILIFFTKFVYTYNSFCMFLLHSFVSNLFYSHACAVQHWTRPN